MARSGSSRKSSGNTTLTLVLILIIALILNVFIFGSLKSKTTPRDTVNLRKTPVTELQQETVVKPQSIIPENFTSIEISSEELHFGELILVNNSTAYVFEGSPAVIAYETPADVYSLKTKDYYIKDTTIDLNPTVIEKLNTMFADYKTATGKADILINAAYRTIDEQAAILEAKGAEIATNPGYSEHHSGYALDICIYSGGVMRTFADEEHYTWIPQNCKKYGFIRRYPQGKTDITGITFEPWHYRYVGVPHSYYISGNGIVLEEYIELLRHYTFGGEHLKIEADGKNYEVYYIPAQQSVTKVYVPTDKAYKISGNNVDGFIVTIDMSEISVPEAEDTTEGNLEISEQ